MTSQRNFDSQEGQNSSDVQRVNQYPKGTLFKRLFRIELRAEAVVNLDDVIGEIDPRIYGLFLADAGNVDLFKALHPPLCRYQVGGDTDQADLDGFLAFCEEVGAQPYLSLNPATMRVDDAARWVQQSGVAFWGLVGSEGFASVEEYIQTIRPFITTMRAVNPAIQLAVAGKAMQLGDSLDAEDWNRAVLAEVGDQIEYLSFSIFHPDEVGLQAATDPEQWHHSLLSAPHGVEELVQQMGELVHEMVPGREIGLVLEGYNVRAPVGTVQEALYVAGMLNVFQRQCEGLKVACLAQGVGVAPMMEQPEGRPAFPTPLYFPYLLYQKMESQLLSLAYWSPVFKAEALGGNIRERNQVPYLDITATQSPDGQRLVLGITNRSPLRKAKVMVNLKGEGARKFRVAEARLMSGPDAVAANTVDAPERVSVRTVKAPRLRFAWLDLELPAASLMVVVLEKK